MEIESGIIKTSIIFDSLIRLEGKFGLLIPLDELLKRVKNELKEQKIKITNKEIKEILNKLANLGAIIRPKPNYIQIAYSYECYNSRH
jgi:DNA-binding HxlR family transcriptional regulator